mgnify:CR=1 FL=1
MNFITAYDVRKAGQEFCKTEGSDHYKGDIEPVDIMISKGIFEDFAIGNIIKYAFRYKVTRNLNDLRKAVDYGHMLCGEVILKNEAGSS